MNDMPEKTSSTANRSTLRPSRRGVLASVLTAAGGFALGWLVPGRQAAPPGEDGETADAGALYHQLSKLSLAKATGGSINWGQPQSRVKGYPEAQQIPLPDPHGYRGLSVEEAIGVRRSQRALLDQPISLEELSRLLHAAQGITQSQGELRAAPSAGALYPIDLYVAVRKVTSLEPGLYHYAVRGHGLELIKAGDASADVMSAGLAQGQLGQASVCLILAATFQRTRWKYHQRSYRYVLIEAGHVGQNICLAAVSMGLGTCVVGAFLDDDLNTLLGIDGQEEAVLGIVTIGHARS
jgi:SagB-type dehydrogenase family enzyme